MNRPIEFQIEDSSDYLIIAKMVYDVFSSNQEVVTIILDGKIYLTISVEKNGFARFRIFIVDDQESDSTKLWKHIDTLTVKPYVVSIEKALSNLLTNYA